MKQQKLLVCLLSTSLLIPSFSINDVSAESLEKSATTSESNDVYKEKDEEQAKQSHSSKNGNDEKNKASDEKENSERKSKLNSTKDERTTGDINNKRHKTSDNKSSNEKIPSSFENSFNDSSSYDSLNVFKPEPFRSDKDGLSELLNQLFSNNKMKQTSTIENNDVQNEKNDSHNDNTSIDQINPNTTYSDDSDESNTNNLEKNSDKGSLQDDIDDVQSSEKSENDDIDNKSESNKLPVDKNQKKDDGESKQSSQQDQSYEEANNDADNLDNKDNDTPATENDNANSDNENADKSDTKSDDKVLDAILDEYSEDAKNNKKQYDAQKDDLSNGNSKSKKNNSEKQASNTNANPQLPSESQLAKKEKPAQSFENDINQSNIRSTATFQQLPNLSDDNNNSNDITITESKNTRDFIKTVAQDAHDIGQDEDIYASVMIAQAILESDSGTSDLASSPHFNLFGIKGAYEGQSATFNTLEDNGNHTFQISANFRSYPSKKESLEDYANLIKHGIDGNQDIYKPTWKSEAYSYRSATMHLATTYATDSQYADKLNSIINHYDLTQFDNKKMPDLDNYKANNDDYDSAFKPFSETTNDSPYPHGQCTWYVYNRMAQFDKYVSGDLGDARNWNNRAERKDYAVSSTPKAHTAVVFEAGQQGADQIYGHVAFVEKVNDDGSIVISESNIKGLGIVSYRTIDADAATELSYITGNN
ncbi:N-acetylmuramoyl-L-alanine amidase [Staphylococcus saprophyticus]|uniref:amidase domain-containing protein n=1 Tax=Staphylococcus saprophyticus TaxID=29385 RepID=UPI0008539BFF|nr:amidase domain-containing protein [Staphylococcus saprophyticus]OEK76039.1 N-acetylmuramoyl-L-alanine amidase [Staphylococcus saprophyticus]